MSTAYATSGAAVRATGEAEAAVGTVARDAGQLLRLVDAVVQVGLAKYARFVLPTDRIARLSRSLSMSAYGSP